MTASARAGNETPSLPLDAKQQGLVNAVARDLALLEASAGVTEDKRLSHIARSCLGLLRLYSGPVKPAPQAKSVPLVPVSSRRSLTDDDIRREQAEFARRMAQAEGGVEVLGGKEWLS